MSLAGGGGGGGYAGTGQTSAGMGRAHDEKRDKMNTVYGHQSVAGGEAQFYAGRGRAGAGMGRARVEGATW